MRKTKVDCFRYKRHYDVCVSNVSFSTDGLLSILDVFPNKRIIILIETDAKYVQTLSSIGKSIGMAEVISHSPVPRFSVACSKMELRCLLSQVNMDDLEGMFIASVNNDIIPDEVICSLDHIASSMVKDGISDISISIHFPENEMVISLSKEQYKVMSMKDKICSIFGN